MTVSAVDMLGSTTQAAATTPTADSTSSQMDKDLFLKLMVTRTSATRTR